MDFDENESFKKDLENFKERLEKELLYQEKLITLFESLQSLKVEVDDLRLRQKRLEESFNEVLIESTSTLKSWDPVFESLVKSFNSFPRRLEALEEIVKKEAEE